MNSIEIIKSIVEGLISPSSIVILDEDIDEYVSQFFDNGDFLYSDDGSKYMKIEKGIYIKDIPDIVYQEKDLFPDRIFRYENGSEIAFFKY